MRILIISQYYYPEQFQINEVAPALVKRGHQVTVICGLPNYPVGKVYPGYKSKDKRFEQLEGVNIIRCWQYPRGTKALSLMFNYVSYPFFAYKAAKRLREEYDVLFCYQVSPVTMALPAVKYRMRHQIPLLLYCLDQWPVSARGHIRSEKSIFYRLITRLSNYIYQRCDRILVTSTPFINYLHNVNKVACEKIGYLPQHASTSMLEMDLSPTNSDKICFMYAGNLGGGQWVDVIIKAVSEIGIRDDYYVAIVGDGSKRIELESLADELGVKKMIRFLGNHSRTDMPSLYKQADVLLITLRGNNEVGNTLPGKLQMYMTTGKPILGAINGAAQEIISDARCGRCVSAGNYKGLALLMKDYLEHKEAYSECGPNARSYFRKHFTLDVFLDNLESELKGLL